MARNTVTCAVALALITSFAPAMAQERAQTQPRAERRQHPNDGMNYRERMAVNYMKQRLKRVFPQKRFKVSVNPTLVQYPGNKQRPVTGNRPVAVDVKVEMRKTAGGVLARTAHRMTAKSKSRYFVDVRRGALPAVVEQQSMTAGAKLRRVLPVGEKIHDIANSRGVRTGAVTGGLGLALSQINLPAALAAVAFGAVEMHKGVNRRTEARRGAVEKTATWARESMGAGVTPSAAEAFSTYKQYLEVQKPGTHPGSFTGFLNRLATQGL